MKENFEITKTAFGVTFRYVKGKSIASGNEIHPYHEILFFIDGGGRFFSEYFEGELLSRTLFVIPKNSYHNFRVANQESYTRLALIFDENELVSELPIFSSGEIVAAPYNAGSIDFLLEKIITLLVSDRGEERIRVELYGAFLMLASELSALPVSRGRLAKRGEDDLVLRCVKYIDDNLSSELTAMKISEQMNVSESGLFKRFKNEMGISIHKYIVEKRLIYANRLIKEGAPPTKVYIECGYSDYSVFYKAYMKMFGNAPSKDKWIEK